MLDQSQRTAILELHKKGASVRSISDALDVSRESVSSVIESNSAEVPSLERPELANPWRDQILEQFKSCQGNLVRVHEELKKEGADFSYQALTAFCRRHGIGHEPKAPAGHYDFAPGDEMQHDTSRHPVKIGGMEKIGNIASLVLCFSRMIFFQIYAWFTRFECKVFLTEALQYFGGAAERAMIDNTHVVVLKGTGADMVPVPEMEAFGERFGFKFAAHEVGDANRSARVENPFSAKLVVMRSGPWMIGARCRSPARCTTALEWSAPHNRWLLCRSTSGAPSRTCKKGNDDREVRQVEGSSLGASACDASGPLPRGSRDRAPRAGIQPLEAPGASRRGRALQLVERGEATEDLAPAA